MVALRKPILIVDDDREIIETPYALECAEAWAGAAGICILASVLLPFMPGWWARWFSVIAGISGACCVYAVVLLFRDHVSGVELLEGDDDGDC